MFLENKNNSRRFWNSGVQHVFLKQILFTPGVFEGVNKIDNRFFVNTAVGFFLNQVQIWFSRVGTYVGV